MDPVTRAQREEVAQQADDAKHALSSAHRVRRWLCLVLAWEDGRGGGARNMGRRGGHGSRLAYRRRRLARGHRGGCGVLRGLRARGGLKAGRWRGREGNGARAVGGTGGEGRGVLVCARKRGPGCGSICA
eukprot:scaffold83389_cov27-Tisochrysis_lutea.AAC.2